MARTPARNARPSLSDRAADKVNAALDALGYAWLRDSAEYKRRPLYYDAVNLWFASLTEDQQETCRTLADVISGPHRAAAEALAAALPPAPKRPP